MAVYFRPKLRSTFPRLTVVAYKMFLRRVFCHQYLKAPRGWTNAFSLFPFSTSKRHILSHETSELESLRRERHLLEGIVNELRDLRKDVQTIMQQNSHIRPKLISTAAAQAMPTEYNEMSSDVLITLAALGDQDAREERLIREIMAVDNLTWTDAALIFIQIANSNRKGLFVATLPYKMGIAGSIFVAFVSFPLTFDYNTVLYFNEHCVTQDVPRPEDLETPLEVAIWAWLWVGPPLGWCSFFLLCMQFARAQMEKLGIKPYTAYHKSMRAERLCQEYPNYDAEILKMFSEGDRLTAKAAYAVNHDWQTLLDEEGKRKMAAVLKVNSSK